MDPLPRNFSDLAPELVIQIAKNLTTLRTFNNLRKTHPHFHRVVVAYEFEICEYITDKEFTPEVRPDVYQLLATQGSLQRSLDSTPEPELSLEATGNTGILSGGTRIGMAEATQLESYKACLEAWKPVYIAETKVHSRGVGNPFPYLGFRVNPFNFSDAELTSDTHLRIDRAFFRFWCIIYSRVKEEQKFSIEMLSCSCIDGTVDYTHWVNRHVAGLQDCPEEVAHLYAMYKWIKAVPRICEPSDEAALEMWEVIVVGEFDYDIQGRMGVEVIPVPRLKGIYGPPGVWGCVGERSAIWGAGVVASVEKLRGLWVLDLGRSLWRTHPVLY